MQFKDQLITPKQSPNLRLLAVFLSLLALWLVAASSGSAAASYSSLLRRYPYLTYVVVHMQPSTGGRIAHRPVVQYALGKLGQNLAQLIMYLLPRPRLQSMECWSINGRPC